MGQNRIGETQLIKIILFFLLNLAASTGIFAADKAAINETDTPEATKVAGFIIYQKKESIRVEKLTQNTVESTWEIEPKMLRGVISEDECFDATAEHCENVVGSDFYKYCTHPCLFYSPSILAIDEKSKTLYFFNHLGIGGTGSAPAMLFEADLSLKSIKKICLIDAFISDSALSPSGMTLAISLGNHTRRIQIIRMIDKKNFDILFPKPSAFKAGESYNVDKDPTYPITSLKWLDETHLQFNEEKHENKWAENPLIVIQKILEINFQQQNGKVISEKIL